MDAKLFIKAITKMALGVILVGLLIFLPAGTLLFFNGWLLMAVLFVPMFFVGVIMIFKNPELSKRRLNAKEQQKEQSLVVRLSGLMFAAGFVVAGLDFRFSWSALPEKLIIIAILVFLLGYLLYTEVIRENMYLFRIIEVEEDQKVIDTGLYSVVRHPMYVATIIFFLSMRLFLAQFGRFWFFLRIHLSLQKGLSTKRLFLKKSLVGTESIRKR